MTDTPGHTAQMQALIGTVVAGRYAIESVLGAGGMGVVYRARQITMNRLVAVKLLHAHYSSNRNAVGRFEREMQATARIEHPNTIRVYDYGQTDAEGTGQFFLAMELLGGKTLAHVLRDEQPLPVARQLKIASQIGKALIAAHAEGVVHRDLKPDNVVLMDLYGDHDFVKVLDFGIARFVAADEDQKLTAEGAVIGTPAYMSPEQVHGTPPDLRTDLYALGIIMFEMATGAVPFSAPTTLSLLVKHVQETPPRPSDLAPGRVPPALEQLILQCLAKDPAQRPADASEVVRRLEAIAASVAASVGGQASPTTTHDVPATPRQSRKTALWAVVGLLVAAGIGVGVWLATKSDRQVGQVANAIEVPRETAQVAPANVPEDVSVNPAEIADEAAALPEVEADPRAGLAAIFAEANEPDLPNSCKTRGPPGTLEVLTQAGRLLAGGGDGEAYDLLTRYAHLIGESPEGQLFLAKATLRAVQTPKSALEPALASVRLCDSAVANAVLGDVYRAMDERDKARDAYLGARMREPEFFEPVAKAVQIEIDDNKPGKAEPMLIDYLRTHPDNGPARLLRGVYNAMKGDAAAAAADFEVATEQAPTDGLAFMLLGDARSDLGELEASKRAYCKAKELGHAGAAEHCP